MEYKIVEKAAFTLMGKKRRFNMETSYQMIPAFWDEHFSGGSDVICGTYGLCQDTEGSLDFDYWIADNYLPQKEIPSGYETVTLPAGLWAVFPCKLNTLQATNDKMWSEWLPSCKKYKLRGNYNVEFYDEFCEGDQNESYVELWLPIEKI